MKALIVLLMLMAVASAAVANNVTISWDDPNPPGTVDHYDIYINDALSGSSLGTTSYVIDLPSGQRYFTYVVAVSPEGLKADPSEVLEFYTLQVMMNLRLN